MLVRRALIAAVAVTACHAAPALAGDRFVARDEPVPATATHTPATMSARRAPVLFNLVGLHWRGTGTVSFRTALEPGAWSGWQQAVAEAGEAPDAGSREARAAAGWTLGSPYWTGPSRYVQYRVSGSVRAVRAYFVWSDPDAAEASSAPAASRAARTASSTGGAPLPTIIRRSQWGADESIVRGRPTYADRVRFAVVHHTAGTNSYSASDSAAIVRGIQRYHVLANGWDDIGYNALVDKYGQIFEGRGGGIGRNVVGAHAEGFNTGSTGVAVLGSYGSRRVPLAGYRALRNFLAWRLDVAHVDPTQRITWISGGNPQYPAGKAVRIDTVSGHRDTGPTSCPGGGLYGQLPSLRSGVEARGLPKIWNPAVHGSLGGPVRVTGRLSAALRWTVTIRDSSGAAVADGSGTSGLVDWTWDASAVFFGDYTYTISVSGARSATYGVPGPPKLEIRGLDARPAVITPNGDGSSDSTRISFSLTTAATTTVTIETAGGATRRTLVSRSLPAGTSRFGWGGRDGSGSLVADGSYRVRVEATSPGQSATATTSILVDRTLGHLSVAPSLFSPNRDGRNDAAVVRFTLARTATVRVRATRGGHGVARIHRGSLDAGRHVYSWNGRNADGIVADGRYRIWVDATTSLGTRSLWARVTVDTARPGLSIRRVRRGTSRTRVTVWLSEPGRLRVWWGSPTWRADEARWVEGRPAGTSSFRLSGRPAQIHVVAFDRAGNKSRARVWSA